MRFGITLFGAALVCCCYAPVARAQQPGKPAPDLRRDAEPASGGGQIVTGPGPLHATPEMWFYEQERTRYEDPKAAVRRRAEYRAAQRDARLASLRWYGMSNSRPAATTTPFITTYSPTYSGSTYDPFVWRPFGPTTVIVPAKSLY